MAANEIFISPTTSYTCKSKAVLTINGSGASVSATVTYRDGSGGVVAVPPGGKITLNGGDKIETSGGVTISGIEVPIDPSSEAPIPILTINGQFSFNSQYQEGLIAKRVPLLDANGEVNFNGAFILYFRVDPFSYNRPDNYDPDVMTGIISTYNGMIDQIYSNLAIGLDATCSLVLQNKVYVGSKQGLIATAEMINGEGIFNVLSQPSDVIAGDGTGGREITSLFDCDGEIGYTCHGDLRTAVNSLVDSTAQYPHIFYPPYSADYNAYPVFVFYPYSYGYDTSIPLVLDNNGNLDLDYYLTNEVSQYTGLRLPKEQFVRKIFSSDGTLPENIIFKYNPTVGDDHTKNNPIVYVGKAIGEGGTQNIGETTVWASYPWQYAVFKDGTVGMICGSTGSAKSGRVTGSLNELDNYSAFNDFFGMECAAISTSIPLAEDALTGVIETQRPPTQWFPQIEPEALMFCDKHYLPLLSYYVDEQKAPIFFGGQTYLAGIFSPVIEELECRPGDWYKTIPAYIKLMPCQSVLDRENRIFDPSIVTPSDLFSSYPSYAFDRVVATSPTTGEPMNMVPTVYLPDITKPLFNASPFGEITIEDVDYIETQDDKITLMVGYASGKAMVILQNNEIRTSQQKRKFFTPSFFGQGGRAKLHCVGLNEDKTEFILIGDNGVCAVSSDGENWQTEDVSALTNGNSIRAISGRYAVGDKGTIIRRDATGWVKVQPNPTPPNFNNLNLTVCEYVGGDNPYHVIAGENGYVAVIPD